MILERLKDKKIAIVGLGVNNVKLAEYFHKNNITYEVIDCWESPDELIGKLDNFEIIFRTPGLPYLSKAVQQAKEKGVEISSQTKLFFELCPAPIIGVTGTKGKGTTSSLIAKILEAGGKKVWLGGNIGKDPFEFLGQIKKDDFVILELSSFQIQDLDQSPHIAVVLNITSDHLNHHQDISEYKEAKSNILKYQMADDFAILHPNLSASFKNLGQAKKIFFTPTASKGFDTKLLGQHNLENIASAVAVAKLLRIPELTIRKAVAEFEALPHRLRVIKQINGITYVDDAFSTNIEPTIAAIEAIKSPMVLILGGHDKGLDFKSLGEKILQTQNVKVLVVIGDVTEKILLTAPGFKGRIFTGAKNMSEILEQAHSIASPGDTILFSPGTSSFGLFKNETDRGDQFVRAVEGL